MSKYGKTLLIRALKLLHYLICIALFCAVWFAVLLRRSPLDENMGRLTFPAVYAFVLLLLLRTYHAYDLMLSRPGENLFSQVLAQLIAISLLYILLSIQLLHPADPLPFLILLPCCFLLDFFWCILCARLYSRLFQPQKTVVIYHSEADLRRIGALQGHPCRFKIIRHIEDPSDDIHALLPLLSDCDAVFIAGIHATLRNGILKYCTLHGIDCFCAPHIGDILLSGGQHLQMFHIPVMRVSPAYLKPEYRFFKRMLDILLSILGLILLSPFMLVTAAAIKLCDGGPVFYRQVRLTRGGRKFHILKFRSMRPDAESDGIARLATDRDARITPVGRIIRACRMDEVPQLFNVLKGDMTLVGPRPERPELAALYAQELPTFPLRLQVKAGLTGFAQIYGRYNTAPYDKLEMDLIYISKMSMVLDLRLIFATVKILFSKESTDGIETGQTTAVDNHEKEPSA